MMTNKEWKYVEKDGNPTEEGEYYVTLIYPEMHLVDEDEDGGYFEETGRTMADVGVRDYGKITDDNFYDVIDCYGQVKEEEGMSWFGRIAGAMEEYVYAWMEKDDIPIAELPDGVVDAGKRYMG